MVPAVLLLNVTYEPLAVIPRRRAMSLWLRDVVDAAAEDELVIQGACSTLHVPTLLRLRRYVNAPRRGVRWTRRGVLQRDDYCCIYCAVRSGDIRGGHRMGKNDFTVDHLLPISRGGRNTWPNTACACPACNQRKGNRTPHEAGMKLLWEPKTPRVHYLVASGDIPESWKVYLEL